MKNGFITLFSITLVCFTFSSVAQTGTLILQPGPKKGKDAYLRSEHYPNRNYGDSVFFFSGAWGGNPEPELGRSLFQFDLAGVLKGASIENAHLSLFNVQGQGLNMGRQVGNNSSWLKRITTDWSEELVTWNNQPLTSNKNAVLLSKSQGEDESYLDVDVTKLVQDMVNYPDSSFGFFLQLKHEVFPAALSFVSSDYPDSSKRPKLVIQYSLPNTTPEISFNENRMAVYPNPAHHFLHVNMGEKHAQIGYQVFSFQGQELMYGLLAGNGNIDISTLNTGAYLIRLKNGSDFENFRFYKY